MKAPPVAPGGTGTPMTEPTGPGDCYMVAADFVVAMPDSLGATLCHGTALGLDGHALGVRYGHAWVEVGDAVLDFSNGGRWAGRRDDYYALGTIEGVRRYTAAEARTLMLSTEHYGPWPE